MRVVGARRRIAADAVITLAVTGGLIFVPLLGWQNVRLREQRDSTPASTAESIRETLVRTIDLSAMEGGRLPDVVLERLNGALQRSGNQDHEDREWLIVAYMPTVCSVCLRQGLESLRQNGWWTRNGVLLHAVVGEQSRGDRVAALRLREAGLLSFPVAFVPSDTLFGALFGHLGSEFAEEPLYLRIDRDFRILTAFQADQRRPELLDQWLRAIDQK